MKELKVISAKWDTEHGDYVVTLEDGSTQRVSQQEYNEANPPAVKETKPAKPTK